MRYKFEKVIGEQRYQARLNGEFIAYVDRKDPELVDGILKEAGYNSREEFVAEQNEKIRRMFS